MKPDVEGEVTREEDEVCIGRWVCSSNFLLMSGVMFDRKIM